MRPPPMRISSYTALPKRLSGPNSTNIILSHGAEIALSTTTVHVPEALAISGELRSALSDHDHQIVSARKEIMKQG